VCLEGYPVRVPLPPGTNIKEVLDFKSVLSIYFNSVVMSFKTQFTFKEAVEVLGDYKTIQNTYRILGSMDEKDLVLTSGRFGPYLRCGDLIW
jgi:hypothetical protein